MASTLQEIEDLWAEGAGDAEAVRAAADTYVAAHAEEFSEYADKTIPDLVASVDVFRAAGWLDKVRHIDVWLWHHFEPQNIGGEAVVQVRIAG